MKTRKHQPRSRIKPAGPKRKKWRARSAMDFREVEGKVLRQLAFDPSVDNQLFILIFEDETELCLAINPGFTVTADYSDWKTGDERVLKSWRAVRNEAG
jgi:hypothetical protein